MKVKFTFHMKSGKTFTIILVAEDDFDLAESDASWRESMEKWNWMSLRVNSEYSYTFSLKDVEFMTTLVINDEDYQQAELELVEDESGL